MHAKPVSEAIASVLVSTMVCLVLSDLTATGLHTYPGIDRPLQHINKKGRPVSQCPHCRGLRKSRAAHVKCDCGEKSHTQEECTHTESGDENGEPHGDFRPDYWSDHVAGEHHTCCCTHGARCSCALKKEHLDTVPEDVPEAASSVPAELRKPRLTATRSESTLTVFTNGHHKPPHKHNDMAHKCGAPYKIPRSHTVHGHSEIAQRSTDSLPLPMRSSVGQELSPHHDSITSAPQTVRRAKSEHGSPDAKSISNLEEINTQIPPLDSSYSPYDASSPALLPFGYTDRIPENYYASQDIEPPLNSAGLSAPSVDWSTFDIYDQGAFSTACRQPPSYASLDHSNLGHPGLTTSSSGEISEVEDYLPLPDPTPNSQDANELGSVGDSSEPDAYRLSSASSYMGMPQTAMLASSNLESLDIDDFLKNAEVQTSALQQLNSNVVAMEPKSFAPQHPLTVQEAQNFAHMGGDVLDTSRSQVEVTIPITTTAGDPMWANPVYDSNTRSMMDSEDPELPNGVWDSLPTGSRQP